MGEGFELRPFPSCLFISVSFPAVIPISRTLPGIQEVLKQIPVKSHSSGARQVISKQVKYICVPNLMYNARLLRTDLMVSHYVQNEMSPIPGYA